GLYLSSHPIREVIGAELPSGYHEVINVHKMNSSQSAKVLAMIKGIRRITTKQNKSMADLEIEDLTGSMEAVVFPKTYDKFSELLEPDQILVFEGKVEERGEQTQILLDSITCNLPGKVDVKPIVETVVIDVPLSGDHW